jgi:deglycase
VIKKIFLVILTIMLSTSAIFAMGEKPTNTPKAETETKSKYKLKILKMEIIPTASQELKLSTNPPAADKSLAGKKVLMVIAPKNFQDKEYLESKKLLEYKGIKITVASSSTKTAKGMFGKKVKPDISLSDAKATDYDAIIFIGGSGSTIYKNDLSALSLAIEAKKHDKVIGAICLAPTILAKSGILKGKKATVSPAGAHILKKAKSKYTGNQVEVDGKIITGDGPAATENFVVEIIKAL